MRNYRVLSRINHDNLSYEPGETLGLNDQTAKPLLDCRVIEPMPEQESTNSGGQLPDDIGDNSDAGAVDTDAATVEAKSEIVGPKAADTNQAETETTAKPSRKTKAK